MTGKKPALFKWQPLSKKQRMVLNWWTSDSGVSDYDGIILDGAIRAGKSLPESVSYIDWAMCTYHDMNLGMAGKTLGALRRNVIGPLKQVLPGRGYKVKDYRSVETPHLEVTKGRRTNYFHLFGGNNEKSQDPVQGFSGGGFYFDEVALMPQSFVNQAEGRCSADESKFWYNCNPEGPYNYIKTDYLDKLSEKRLLHLHFLMDDNLSLSQKTRDRYERRWSKGSIFYRRYINGEWCLAEGVIYDFFDPIPGKGYVVDSLPGFSRYLVGVDYGTANACCFLLLGESGNTWYVAKEYYWDSVKQGRQKTNLQYSSDFKEFIGSITPYSIEVDPSALSFITQLRQDFPQLMVKHAINQVLPGIQTVSSLMTSGRLKIHSSCKNTIQSISSYTWDPKAQLRGEDAPMKVNDHASDSLRYSAMRAVRI